MIVKWLWQLVTEQYSFVAQSNKQTECWPQRPSRSLSRLPTSGGWNRGRGGAWLWSLFGWCPEDGGVTIDSLSTKRYLQRKLKPNFRCFAGICRTGGFFHWSRVGSGQRGAEHTGRQPGAQAVQRRENWQWAQAMQSLDFWWRKLNNTISIVCFRLVHGIRSLPKVNHVGKWLPWC